MLLLPDNSQRAKYALTAFYTLLVAELALMMSNIYQLILIKRIAVGNYTEEEVVSNDQRHTMIAYIYLGILVITAIVFIFWFRRAYRNLDLSGRANTQHADNWAVGCWFVPFLNLYRPFEIMKEIWIKTQQSIPNLLNTKSSQIIGIWWVTWLVSSIIANIGNRFISQSSIEDYITSVKVQIVSDVLEVVALVLIITIVKQTSRMETALQLSLVNEEEKINESDDKLDFIYT